MKEHQLNEDLYSSLTLNSLLASGMTSDVYLSDMEGTKIVVKIFNNKNKKFYLNEVNFLQNMPPSKHLIRVHGYGQINRPNDNFNNRHYIVMDYAKNGDLVNLIETKGAMSELEVKDLLIKIIDGVNDIHKAGFVHRDLKPENVLIGDNLEMLLTDFGFVDKIDSITKEKRGTQGYMPPEILLQQSKIIPEAIDVFSIGVISFILMTGEFPFDTPTKEDSFYRLIIDNEWEEYWRIVDSANLTKGFKDMIQKMICPFPENRLSLKQLMNHSWLQNHQEQ